MKNYLRTPFRYTYINVAIILIVINVLIYALQFITRGFATFYLALNPIAVLHYKMYWQFITYMFVHDPNGWSHILFNMIALFMFGTALERHIGSKEFIIYYLITGTFAGAASFAIYVFFGLNPYLLGASGALFAVQLAYAAFFPQSYVMIWGILPLRAPIMVIAFTAIELFSGVAGRDNTAHFTHLFGFAAAVLYFFIRFGQNPFRLMFPRRY